MRCVVQRVASASVTVNQKMVGSIQKGVLIFIGIASGDTELDKNYMINKVAGLRIFEDENQKMNLSLMDVGGAMLAISQFTLLGDVRGGKRPSFIMAEKPDIANKIYLEMVAAWRDMGIDVQTGVFQAHMDVALVNDGPVTILIDSKKQF